MIYFGVLYQVRDIRCPLRCEGDVCHNFEAITFKFLTKVLLEIQKGVCYVIFCLFGVFLSIFNYSSASGVGLIRWDDHFYTWVFFKFRSDQGHLFATGVIHW